MVLSKSENQIPPDYVYTGDLVLLITVDIEGHAEYYVKSIDPQKIATMLTEVTGDFRPGGDMWLDFHDSMITEEDKIIRDEYSLTMKSIDHEEFPFVLLWDGDDVELRAHDMTPAGMSLLLRDAADQLDRSAALHDQAKAMEDDNAQE